MARVLLQAGMRFLAPLDRFSGVLAAVVATQPHIARRFSTLQLPSDADLLQEQLQQPNPVHPISITQMDNLVRHPTLRRMSASARFLQGQLPARLDNHIARLQALLPECGPQLHDLLSRSIASKAQLLSEVHSSRAPDASEGSLLEFENRLSEFKAGIEVEMARLVARAQELAEQPGWWEDSNQVRLLDSCLDLSHWYLLSARVMLNQHSAALGALVEGVKLPRSAPLPSAANTPYLTDNAPLWSGSSANRPRNLVRRHAPLRGLLEAAAQDCRAFCVEKNSAAPAVKFQGGEGLQPTLLVPYVCYVFEEMLKNAMQSVIARYGAWDVDDADPVMVTLEDEKGSSHFTLSIVDGGNGVHGDKLHHMHSYFYSSARRMSLMYGYSRDHGSQFQGLGVGVPLARVYCHFMGGSIEWHTPQDESDEDGGADGLLGRRGTTVLIRLPKAGFVF